MLEKPLERRYVHVQIEIPIDPSSCAGDELFKTKGQVIGVPYVDGIQFLYPGNSLGDSSYHLLRDPRIMSVNVEKRTMVYIDAAGTEYTRGNIYDAIHKWIKKYSSKMDWLNGGDGSIGRTSRAIYEKLQYVLNGRTPAEALQDFDPESFRQYPEEAEE